MPNAELISGLRGTPFGEPVVPDVSSTMRPAAATLGREPPSCASTLAASITLTPWPRRARGPRIRCHTPPF